ncbi:hypothetical protein HDK77DRAFT_232103 [Phyllosticta capitalensis]
MAWAWQDPWACRHRGRSVVVVGHVYADGGSLSVQGHGAAVLAGGLVDWPAVVAVCRRCFLLLSLLLCCWPAVYAAAAGACFASFRFVSPRRVPTTGKKGQEDDARKSRNPGTQRNATHECSTDDTHGWMAGISDKWDTRRFALLGSPVVHSCVPASQPTQPCHGMPAIFFFFLFPASRLGSAMEPSTPRVAETYDMWATYVGRRGSMLRRGGKAR